MSVTNGTMTFASFHKRLVRTGEDQLSSKLVYLASIAEDLPHDPSQKQVVILGGKKEPKEIYLPICLNMSQQGKCFPDS